MPVEPDIRIFQPIPQRHFVRLKLMPILFSQLKSIDGVYDSDPAVNPDAKKYDSMQMADIVDNKLGVVDLAAAVLCLENKMPMLIFGLNEENSIANAVAGKSNGTIITVD